MTSSANRSGGVAQAGAQPVAAQAAGGSTLTLTRTHTSAPTAVSVSRSRAMRVGFGLTIVGFLFHAAATVLRGIAAERVPFANM